MTENRPATPLISIVTVVLNAAATLERTIRSVVQQSFVDFEYVIIDGGSTDGTLEIVRKYDSAVSYWRSEPDGGLYDAMNKGVRAARGRWILFVGADDVLVGDLTKIAPLLTDANTIYYGDVYMPKRGRLYDGAFSAYKIMLANICQQAIFYPRRAFERHAFDTRYKLWADHAFNLACFGDKRFQFKYIPHLICIYNDYNGASSNTEDAVFIADRGRLIRTHLPPSLFLAYLLRNSAAKLKRWCSAVIKGRNRAL